MGCSTFFFGSSEDLTGARKCLQREGVEHEWFTPSPLEQAIRIWAVSVSDELSSRAKEILFTRNSAVIGYYDLLNPERPLPTETDAEPTSDECTSFIKKMWLAFIGQCFADPTRIRLIAHCREDIGPLLPYLNSVTKAAQYNPSAPTLCYRKGIRMITLYNHRIAVAKADDLLDAWLCFKEIRQRIDHVHQRKHEITPNFEKSEPPSVLKVYRLLPQTNCGHCGQATCMAFAAVLIRGEVQAEECLALWEERWAKNRSHLFELLGGFMWAPDSWEG